MYTSLALLSPPSFSLRLSTSLPFQIFSIIVFGCISDKVESNFNGHDYCLYNNSNACSFGVAVGVIAFLFCLIFLVKDVLYVVIDFSNNIMVSHMHILLRL